MNKYLYFISVMLKAVIQYLLIFLVSHAYSAGGLSDYYFIVACYSIISIVLTFGINNSFIRFSKLTRINATIYGKCTIFFASLIFFSGLLFLNFEKYIYLIAALSFTKGLYLLFESISVSIGNYSRVIKSNFYYLIVILLSFGAVEDYSLPLRTFLLLLALAESTIIISFSLRYLSSAHRKSINTFWQKIKSLIGYSLFLWVIGFLNTLLFTFDRIVIEHFLESEALAVYGTLAVTYFSVHRFFSTPYLTLVARNYYILKNGMYLFRYTVIGLLPLLFSLFFIMYVSPWIFQFLSISSPDFSFQMFTALNVIALYLYSALIIEFKREAKMLTLFIVTMAMASISILFNYLTVESLKMYAPLISFALAYTIGLLVLLLILGFKKHGIRNTR